MTNTIKSHSSIEWIVTNALKTCNTSKITTIKTSPHAIFRVIIHQCCQHDQCFQHASACVNIVNMINAVNMYQYASILSTWSTLSACANVVNIVSMHQWHQHHHEMIMLSMLLACINIVNVIKHIDSCNLVIKEFSSRILVA